MTSSLYLAGAGVLHADFEREWNHHGERSRKRGCRERRDVLQAGRSWAKEHGGEGALALLCRLTNPQENPNHPMLPWELELCVSGMQKHRDTQELASRLAEEDLFDPLTCRPQDKAAKSRDGSSGGVREALCSEPQRTPPVSAPLCSGQTRPRAAQQRWLTQENGFGTPRRLPALLPQDGEGGLCCFGDQLRLARLCNQTGPGRGTCQERPGEVGDWGAHMLALNLILGP